MNIEKLTRNIEFLKKYRYYNLNNTNFCDLIRKRAHPNYETNTDLFHSYNNKEFNSIILYFTYMLCWFRLFAASLYTCSSVLAETTIIFITPFLCSTL